MATRTNRAACGAKVKVCVPPVPVVLRRVAGVAGVVEDPHHRRVRLHIVHRRLDDPIDVMPAGRHPRPAVGTEREHHEMVRAVLGADLVHPGRRQLPDFEAGLLHRLPAGITSMGSSRRRWTMCSRTRR
jgi:hypothetical protein